MTESSEPRGCASETKCDPPAHRQPPLVLNLQTVSLSAQRLASQLPVKARRAWADLPQLLLDRLLLPLGRPKAFKLLRQASKPGGLIEQSVRRNARTSVARWRSGRTDGIPSLCFQAHSRAFLLNISSFFSTVQTFQVQRDVSCLDAPHPSHRQTQPKAYSCWPVEKNMGKQPP